MQNIIRFTSFIMTVALICLLSAILSACKSPQDKIMDKAEAIMNEHPDTARKLLESISGEQLHSQKRKARHTVLLTEARYKTFEDDTTSEPISMAAEYFADDLRNPYRMKAFYYKSKILHNNKKGGEALISLMNSEKTASLRHDTLWLGLIHGSIGRNFAKLNNPSASIPWLEMAIRELNGKQNNHYLGDYVLLLAKEYYNCALCSDELYPVFVEKAIRQADILTEIAHRENDPEYLYKAKHLIAKCFILQDKHHEAKDLLIDIADNMPMYMTSDDYVNLGELYLKENDIVKAKTCQDSVARLDPKRMSLNAAIAQNEGDYKAAFDYLVLNQKHNQEEYKIWLQRDQAEIIFDNFRLSNRNLELIISNQYLVIGLLCSMMIIIGFFFLYRHNRSKNERKKILSQAEDLREIIYSLERKCDELNKLQNNDTLSYSYKKEDNGKNGNQNMLISRTDAVEKVKGILKDALSDQFSMLDRLTAKFYEVKDMPAGKNQIYKMIEDIVSSIRDDEKIIQDMTDIVNRYLDGLMTSLKTDLPKITNNDFRIFLFTVSGFSSKSISVFENVDVDKIYNRKYSLKKKLERLPDDIKNKYLQFL